MKKKDRVLAGVIMAALLAAGGLWLRRSGQGPGGTVMETTGTGLSRVADGQPGPGEMDNPTNGGRTLAPPDQTRRFREFTPEQRVLQARKGHGPGG